MQSLAQTHEHLPILICRWERLPSLHMDLNIRGLPALHPTELYMFIVVVRFCCWPILDQSRHILIC